MPDDQEAALKSMVAKKSAKTSKFVQMTQTFYTDKTLNQIYQIYMY